jgi:hypothetical protein
MRWQWLILAGAGMLAGILALPLNPRVSPTDPESPTRRLEVARLREHFDSVDAELRGPQALELAPSQHTNRLTLIGWLREYRDAGMFPQNDRFPRQAVPFFRDSRGVLCAMAYLIDRSGRGDLVDRVALTRNNAYIPELADDPALLGWLDSVGLSVAEAARIQPGYNGGGGNVVDEESVSTEYAATSIVVSSASLITVGLNLIDPSKSSGWAGLVAGTAGLIAGAVSLDETGDTETLAAANMIIGGGAIAAGLYRLIGPPQPAASNARLAISPLVTATSGRPRLGLAMHTSF